MNPRTFQAHRTQLCNVPGCDCSCPNCRVPPLPQSRLAEYNSLSRHDWPFALGIAAVFVVVFLGPALGWWAL